MIKNIIKSFAFIAVLGLSTYSATAQSSNLQVSPELKTAIKDVMNHKTPTDLEQSIKTFDQLARANEENWLPLYYKAIQTIRLIIEKPTADYKELYTSANEALEQASGADPENSNIMTAKAWLNYTMYERSNNAFFLNVAKDFYKAIKPQGNAFPHNYFLVKVLHEKYATDNMANNCSIAKTTANRGMGYVVSEEESTIFPNFSPIYIQKAIEQCK